MSCGCSIENDSFTNGAVMKVYPNPASDRVFLSGSSGDLELSILDVSGSRSLFNPSDPL